MKACVQHFVFFYYAYFILSFSSRTVVKWIFFFFSCFYCESRVQISQKASTYSNYNYFRLYFFFHFDLVGVVAKKQICKASITFLHFYHFCFCFDITELLTDCFVMRFYLFFLSFYRSVNLIGNRWPVCVKTDTALFIYFKSVSILHQNSETQSCW